MADCRGNRVNTSKLLDHSLLDTDCSDHKAMECTDGHAPVLLRQWIHFSSPYQFKINQEMKFGIPWYTWHNMNGLPDIPEGQVQVGTWLITSHTAFWPQILEAQGLTHLFREQALFREHSSLVTHSGRQAIYGSPWYSAKQVHTPSWHCAFCPHGEGWHGSFWTGSSWAVNKKKLYSADSTGKQNKMEGDTYEEGLGNSW